MRRIILILFIALFAGSAAIAQDRKPVFKKYYWGTPYEQIQEGEFREGTFGPGSISFTDKIEGLDCLVTYKLSSGKLSEIKIVFTNNHEIGSGESYYKDFKAVNEYLNIFYGTPIFCGPNWKTSENVSVDNVDLAILEGKVSFIGKWETNTASVLHYLTAHDMLFEHLITIR